MSTSSRVLAQPPILWWLWDVSLWVKEPLRGAIIDLNQVQRSRMLEAISLPKYIPMITRKQNFILLFVVSKHFSSLHMQTDRTHAYNMRFISTEEL
jgi:hypothetical protein